MKDQLVDLLRERAKEFFYEERRDGKIGTSALLLEAADQLEQLREFSQHVDR